MKLITKDLEIDNEQYGPGPAEFSYLWIGMEPSHIAVIDDLRNIKKLRKMCDQIIKFRTKRGRK